MPAYATPKGEEKPVGAEKTYKVIFSDGDRIVKQVTGVFQNSETIRGQDGFVYQIMEKKALIWEDKEAGTTNLIPFRKMHQVEVQPSGKESGPKDGFTVQK